jgi:chemosensory pili system protein ChpA (sensor histidine kinase/response regulator)
VDATEDDLVAQARQTRELQRDPLRTRMVEFEEFPIALPRGSDRLRRHWQAGEAGSAGGTIEMDRGMLGPHDPCLEHLLRNCAAHGIESPEARCGWKRSRWVDHRPFEARRQRRFCRLVRRWTRT